MVSALSYKRGYAQADSTISLLVKAKGNFVGTMYAAMYDVDGVQVCSDLAGYICDNSVYIEFPHSALPFLDGISGDKPYQHSWQQGEAQRATVSIPFNASKIELRFAQARY